MPAASLRPHRTSLSILLVFFSKKSPNQKSLLSPKIPVNVSDFLPWLPLVLAISNCLQIFSITPTTKDRNLSKYYASSPKSNYLLLLHLHKTISELEMRIFSTIPLKFGVIKLFGRRFFNAYFLLLKVRWRKSASTTIFI